MKAFKTISEIKANLKKRIAPETFFVERGAVFIRVYSHLLLTWDFFGRLTRFEYFIRNGYLIITKKEKTTK